MVGPSTPPSAFINVVTGVTFSSITSIYDVPVFACAANTFTSDIQPIARKKYIAPKRPFYKQRFHPSAKSLSPRNRNLHIQ